MSATVAVVVCSKYTKRTHTFFVDARAGNDPEFKMAERLLSMPRDEAYSETVRMYCSMLEKAKEYGYVGKNDSEFAYYSQ